MGLPIDPDENIVVTCGSTEAMMAAMMTACNPGDRVIVFSPFYENYVADTILSGAEPIYVPLRPPTFSFDPDELRRAFAQKPKALILCNPANPSGRVFTRPELDLIAALAEEVDAFVITDEVYEHIVYAPHVTSTSPRCRAWPSGPSVAARCRRPTRSPAGGSGYIIAAPEIIADARKVHDFLTVGAAAPLQEAAIAGLELPDSYYDELQRSYTAKRDMFLGYLRRAGLTFSEPEGAYYVMVDISEFGCPSDVGFCEWLASEVGVAAVPGSSFFREPEQRYIRFHFAKREETLIAAGERLLGLRERAASRPASRAR